MIKLKQILTEITCKDALDALAKISSMQVINNLTRDNFTLDFKHDEGGFGGADCDLGPKDEPAGFTVVVKDSTIKDKDGNEKKSSNEQDIFLTQLDRIVCIFAVYSNKSKIKISYNFYGKENKTELFGINKATIDNTVGFGKFSNKDIFIDTVITNMLSWAVYVTGTKYEKDMQAKGGEYADYELDIDPANVYSYNITSYQNAKKTQPAAARPTSTVTTLDKDGTQSATSVAAHGRMRGADVARSGGGSTDIQKKKKQKMDQAKRERE